MTLHNQQQGQFAEQQACQYLLKQGLQLVEKNYRCPLGEIDLIMREHDCIIFIEVRSRSSEIYGHASTSINRTKQQKLIKSALYFLQKNKLIDKIHSRFDVIAIHFFGDEIQIEWFKNAFCPAN